jgi:formylmethanofuran dehydrogenase subunit E
MIKPREYLETGFKLHGHKCPAMPLGLRVGAAAMNALGVERSTDGQLIALVELGDAHCSHCFADGIQVITGCTFGKGNIHQLGYGKFGLTLIDVAHKKAVRVVPKAEVQVATKKTEFFKSYREKGVPASKVPAKIVEPLIEMVMDEADEQLMTISPIFEYEVEKSKESFESFVCDQCGEMVVEKYGRVYDGLKVCIPCQEKLLAG